MTERPELDEFINNSSEEFKKLNADVLEIRKLSIEPKSSSKNKYHAERAEFKGHIYPSKKQARDARDLFLRLKAHDIICYCEEVPFELQGGIKYRADFVVVENDFSVHILDSKGIQTKEFRLKRKLFREKYGRDIEVL